MKDTPTIQTIELGEATLDRIDAMLTKAADEIANRLGGEQYVSIEGLSASAFLDLVEIIKRALDEREEQ